MKQRFAFSKWFAFCMYKYILITIFEPFETLKPSLSHMGSMAGWWIRESMGYETYMGLGCKILTPCFGDFSLHCTPFSTLPGIDYPCGLVASTATDLSFLMVLSERQNHFFVRETNRHDLYIYIFGKIFKMHFFQHFSRSWVVSEFCLLEGCGFRHLHNRFFGSFVESCSCTMHQGIQWYLSRITGSP